MEKCKVLQVTIDIIVGPECNGNKLADKVFYELERIGFSVIGSAYQGDITETYKENYPEVFED